MHDKKGKWRAGWLLIIVLLIMTGCSKPSAEETRVPTQAATAEATTTATATPQPTAVPSVPETETRISLSAIGDVLIHSSVWKDARKEDGSYDFRPMFQQVKEKLEATDITFANSESIIGGESLGLSSYPAFNSPFEVGDALKDAGVDIVSMANNHTLDFREKAIVQAADHWDKLGILFAGANRSEEERNRIRIIERKGVKIAFLAYTYGTNGIPVPAGKEYLVNLLDKDRLIADIRQAKQEADAVVVSMHWGIEYARIPNEEQRQWAQLAADEGAAVVIGHHPHVLQPVEWVQGKDGNRTLVFYSLGNFLAAQEKLDPYRQIGGIARMDLVFKHSASGTEVSVENPGILPTYIQFRNWKGYRIVPLHTASLEILPERSKYEKDTLQLLTKYMPELSVGE
ncbi:CapA family protein [Gorillibacterium timonense]|uniref:CapA family protein n=1 Tax=Gorillibacterium timonense TaxID=1689269 RepID=UPI00071CF666|nr:CapA family protein [Gorillibacterium timonense]